MPLNHKLDIYNQPNYSYQAHYLLLSSKFVKESLCQTYKGTLIFVARSVNQHPPKTQQMHRTNFKITVKVPPVRTDPNQSSLSTFYNSDPYNTLEKTAQAIRLNAEV